MTTLVTGAAGFLGSHVARQLVARGDDVRVLLRTSSTNRAIADLSLEYVTGDLRDPASLDRAMKGVKRVFHVAADYRLWARRSREIYDSNVGGTKNLLEAAKRVGVEQLIYTSTVATIAVDRPKLPNEFTDAKLQEMVGHYKRSKWMAEREALNAAKNGLPVIVAMPTTPVGPWDWLRGDRLEFCQCGRVRGRPPAARGKRKSRGALSSGRGESDAQGHAGHSSEDNRPARAQPEDSSRTRAGCSLCQYGVFKAAWTRAGYSD